MRRASRLVGIVAAASAAGLAAPASAHPHVFVDATAGFLLDDQDRLEALRISWTYDAFTSLVIFESLGLDGDGDGRLDEADRAAIVAGETDWPPDYEGDVYLDRSGAPVDLARPVNATASMEGDRIKVAFDLPLAAPLASPGGVRLRLYDPYYYFAYLVFDLEAGATGPCTAVLDRFEPEAADETLLTKLSALSREETPSREDVGALFADEVFLSCP